MRRFLFLLQIIASILIGIVVSGQLQARSLVSSPARSESIPLSGLPATTSPTLMHGVTSGTKSYLPIVFTAVPSSLPAPIRMSEDIPIEFSSVRGKAQDRRMDAAPNKIGFHVGIGGNRDGLKESIALLDAAGIPVFLKTANDAEPLYETQELMKLSGVPHTLVYRDVSAGIIESSYSRSADQVAQDNWQLNVDVFPPELDPSLVWLETINEPNKNHAAWLAEFSLAQAKLAVADGYKYAAFSWSSGEPELAHWELPEMLEFLRFAGKHPENVAVALHEYSFETDFIGSGSSPYPWSIGRFQKLFAICDKHNIPRPTILVTEWGWQYDDVPDPVDAMKDIEWASWLYAAYPQVKGAAIWYLGEGDQFGSIHKRAQKLIAPVHEYSERNYFIIYPGQFPIDEAIFTPKPPTADRH